MHSMKLSMISLLTLALISCQESGKSSLAMESAAGSFEFVCGKTDVAARSDGFFVRMVAYTPTPSSNEDDAVSSDVCTIRANSSLQGLRFTKINYGGGMLLPTQDPVLEVKLDSQEFREILPKSILEIDRRIYIQPLELGCPGQARSAQFSFTLKGSASLDEIAIMGDVVPCS
ncbi:MAG TPA: hypothetical protein VFO10_01350 [Oligoflexus sp.]|uniref:hypothetical protein n=1 Tax=Oligoflexus sp. TaxID=1971216 RepID=UPI002D7FE7D4|nr:hypothetical protein [Oligoflexus sp.]HET9235863.1 hypothetical protein [Oligoflexus sp.]